AANGSATMAPSASRTMQPISSQVTPAFSEASFGVRASASAASHSRTGNVSPLAERMTDSLPEDVRTPTTSPRSPTYTSGTGARNAQSAAARTNAQPLQ